MKISPMPTGQTVAAAEVSRPDIKRIQMKTQASPERFDTPEPLPAETENTITSANEPEAEVSKPLSPQFAALAKQKRAIQVKEMELAKREKELQAKSSDGSEVLTKLKADPLSVLSQAGVTYEQLTEAILASDSNNPEIHQLRAELKATKEGFEKSLTDRDTQARQQAVSQIKREVNSLVAQGDAFETIRTKGMQHEVVRLIENTYDSNGELLSEAEACQLIEDQLVENIEKDANIPKIRARLTPQEQLSQQRSERQPNRNQPMRTLTNRDTAKPVLSRRDRMIAAMNGTLKR